MKPRIRFHPAARDEYVAAAERYEISRAGLGEDFLGEVEAYVDRVASGQLPGSAFSTGARANIRRLPLRRFPYVLYFEIKPDLVIVWAVSHARREPGYWRRRT